MPDPSPWTRAAGRFKRTGYWSIILTYLRPFDKRVDGLETLRFRGLLRNVFAASHKPRNRCAEIARAGLRWRSMEPLSRFAMIKLRLPLLLVLGGAALALSACGTADETPSGAPKGERAAGAGAGGAGGPGGGRGGPGGGPGGGRPATVTAGTVAPHVFTDSVEAVGTAFANESVEITANVTERIKAIRFSDGAFVRRGDVLVELSAAEESADLNTARARLREAELQLQRVRQLAADGFATRARLDTQVALRDAARGDVAMIEARLADRVIRAPFSGVIGLRRVSPGLVVGAGTPILTIQDLSRIKLDFTVPETVLAQISRGMEVRAIAAAYPSETFRGRVEGIDPQIDPVTRAASVRAIIDNPDRRLKPGMLLTVRIIKASRTALAVPEQALVALREERAVFRITPEDQAERVVVTTGTREPGYVEITGGIEAGARIVVDGTVKVRDGGKVSVSDQKPTKPALVADDGGVPPTAEAVSEPGAPAASASAPANALNGGARGPAGQ